MVFGGNCISKINGKTVFVPFAIPGEKLEVEIVQEKSDYDIARIINIIEPSEHRVQPACKYYGKCGGCNLMHIDYEYQKTLRKQILRELFEHNGLECPEIEVISGNPFNYRNRFQLTDGGLSEKASSRIVNIESCPVACEEINQWLSKTPVSQRPAGRCHVFGGSQAEVNAANEQKVYVSQNEERTEEKTIKYRNKNIKQAKKRYSGTMFSSDDTAKVTILGKQLSFDVRGFFQSNLNVLEKTVEEVTKYLSGENVLDMYAGCGTFSVFLADKFEKVTLVEHNRDALVFAEQNLAGKNHQSFGLSGEKWISSGVDQKFDAIVIDPPRSGIEKKVIDFICKSGISVVRSVSCDPATHSRDAKILVNAGYALEKLYLLDFYPHTSHIESLAWFIK